LYQVDRKEEIDFYQFLPIFTNYYLRRKHMGKKYKQLTIEERCQIEILLKSGNKLKEIATILQRSKATISRELNRNRGQRGYRHQQAQRKANMRRFKGQPYKMTSQVKNI
jgi:IS30 family transposase